jgi:hypothetical protein
MLLNSGGGLASHRSDLVQPAVSFVAAFKLGSPTLAQPLDVEGVSELQQPILMLRQLPKVSGRRALETLSGLESR